MNVQSPLFSIIVPVFKVEKYLSRCIDSILAQTSTDFELLLVDDGSPDNSGSICDKYALTDSRIQVFHKKNGGVSSARNFGLDNANGKWIVFCDSDDWVEKDWLESYHNAINNIVDIIFQGYIQEHHTHQQIHCIRNFSNKYTDTIFFLEQKDLLGWTWCKIFKASIIEDNKIRFNTTLDINEDLLFTLQYCYYARSISILPAAKYHYIIYEDSLTKKKHPYKELQNKNNLIKKARQQIANRDEHNIRYNQWINEKYCADMVYCLKTLYSNQPQPALYERRKMLKLVSDLKPQISRYSAKDKLLLIILKILPYSITDYIFRSLSTIQKLLQ